MVEIACRATRLLQNGSFPQHLSAQLGCEATQPAALEKFPPTPSPAMFPDYQWLLASASSQLA